MAITSTQAPVIIDATSVRLKGLYSWQTGDTCPFMYGFMYRILGAATFTYLHDGIFATCTSPSLYDVAFDEILTTTAETKYEFMAVLRNNETGEIIAAGDIVPFTTPPVAAACDLAVEVSTTPATSSSATDGSIYAPATTSAANFESRLIPGYPDFTISATLYQNLAAGSYTLEFRDANGCTLSRTVEITTESATSEPPVVTDPKTYFKPVGGVLDNPIILSLAVVSTDNQGQPKKNHFVEFQVFRGNGVSIGKARGRVRNGQATADISTYLRGVLKCRPEYDMLGTVAGDTNAFVKYYVVTRESWGGFFQPDKAYTTLKTVAVNAATKDYAGNLLPYTLTT